MTFRTFLTAGCLLGLSWVARAEESADFQAVCNALRQTTFVQADFREEKTLQMLARPLQSKGTLMFSPKRGVYRRVLEPVRQEMLITRTMLMTKNAEGVVERMNVNRQPAARGFVQVFLSFFSGDEKAWKKTFDLSFSGTPEAWKIAFTPLAKSPVAKALRGIVLEGSQGILTAMTLTEVNGDTTRTFYENPHLYQGAEGDEALKQFPMTLQ